MTKALLFDLDGTLIMSDHLHYEVFADLFAERGKELTPEIYADQIHGHHNLSSFPSLFPGEDPQEMSDLKEAMFRDRLTGADPMPGAPALLDRAQAEGWATAIVTNAPRGNAHHMLSAIGLADRFDLIVIGDECDRAKPDPEPYLHAMRELGAQPGTSIAFEDSESGMRAAAASGAYAVGIRSGLSDDRLRAEGAQITLQDFNDPALPAILARVMEDTQ